MGIDIDVYLIVGWEIDEEHLKKWLISMDAGSCQREKDTIPNSENQCLCVDCWDIDIPVKNFHFMVCTRQYDRDDSIEIYFTVDEDDCLYAETMHQLLDSEEMKTAGEFVKQLGIKKHHKSRIIKAVTDIH